MTVLVDTSVLIDLERGADIDLPGNTVFAIATMTLAELNVGLLLAGDMKTRRDRLDTFTAALGATALPFDSTVARTYGELFAWASEVGVRPSVADGIIAATAATHGLPLVTRDIGMRRLVEFDGLELIVV